MINEVSNEPQEGASPSRSSTPAKKRSADAVWGERGLITKGWVALPHLLTRNLAALGMEPAEFALVMALMGHKGEQDPWLANKTLARYLGMTVRGVQKLVARCDGRWFHRISRKTEDGRDLCNTFDLTPLIDRMQTLRDAQGSAPVPARNQSKRRKAGEPRADARAQRTAQGAAQHEPVEPDVTAPLTLEAQDFYGTSLRNWVVGAFGDAVADLGVPMGEDAKERIGRKLAARLTREQLQAAASKFPSRDLERVLSREEGTSFAAFARALVDEYAGPWLKASVAKRHGEREARVLESAQLRDVHGAAHASA